MNVLSCFDGMSCGQIALERIGRHPSRYYASEIDRHAIKVTQSRWPSTIQMGDVRNVRPKELGWLDLILAGSPCQGFSFAGKMLNFDDPRSALFFEFIRVLTEAREINPEVKFFLENVEMLYEHELVISRMLGVNPIRINSALVSAQNRERLYWTNINLKPSGLFGFPEPDIPQPKDLGIVLRDILEDGIGGLHDRGKFRQCGDKSTCIDANYWKGIDNHAQRTFVYLNSEELERARHKYSSKVWRSGKRMGNMKFPDSLNGKSKCMSATVIKGARETIHVQDQHGIRLLTPLECERLQTVPENYTAGVSDTARYRMLGNGWTIDVIAHILKYL